jgi:hypothetical protein
MNPRIHEKYYPGDKLVARNRPDWKPVCKELHKIREDNGSENRGQGGREDVNQGVDALQESGIGALVNDGVAEEALEGGMGKVDDLERHLNAKKNSI